MGRTDGLRLPIRRRDWRLMARTTRLVLSIPAYAAVGLVAGLVALSVFVFTRNPDVLRLVLFGGLPLDASVELLLAMYPLLGPAYTLLQSVLLLVTASLVGANLALVTYHFREHRVSLSEGSGSAGGVLLGTLGAGCASCGSAVLAGLLSLFGASGALTLLPLDGLEFALVAIVGLLLSTFWVADGMRGGTVAGCPVSVDALGGEEPDGSAP
jgi:hypothetical protein